MIDRGESHGGATVAEVPEQEAVVDVVMCPKMFDVFFYGSGLCEL